MKRLAIILFSIAILAGFTAPKSYAADDITGHYFESSIRSLVAKGIMGGYGEGIYGPDRAVTRAEFATLVIRSLNLAETASTTPEKQLTDLEPGKWYTEAVNQAIALGIVGGYPDNTFKPNNIISRQEMAAMIMRAIDTQDVYSEPATLTFKDADKINPIFKDAVQRLVNLKVMNGNADNTFGPKTSTTRGQMAAVLERMIKVLSNEPVVTTTNYDLTVSEMIQKQMAINPQTDKYRNDKTYVSGDYVTGIIEENGKKYGFITNTTFLNVREGPGTQHRLVGKLNSIIEDPTKIELLAEIENDKKEIWYEVKYGAWRNAKEEDVAQYVNPANFKAGTKDYYQFLVLSKRAGASVNEINNKILASAGVLAGKGQTFIDASKQYNINEIYLVSHALLETGRGTSNLAKGIKVSEMKYNEKGKLLVDVNGNPLPKPVEERTVYNIFGIGAYDACADDCGAERAYREGWFTIEDAIIGGAKYISEDYINNPTYKQDTLYKMRWNPAKPATHQYASDVGWAVKQVTRIHEMYQLLDSYTLYYDVPVYKK